MSKCSPYARDWARALLLALIAYSSWNISAVADEPRCPPGPFETDRAKIAAAIASMPALAKALGREHPSSTKPDAWTLIDGVATEGGGGLAPPAREGEPVSLSAREEYDPDRYVARYVRTEATLRGNRLVDERYFTRTIRATVEQARAIACLVNQLLQPPVPAAKQEPAPPEDPSKIPAEIVVIAPPRPCSVEYTDGHWEGMSISVGGAQAGASPALSCGDSARLQALLSGAVNTPFLE
jgi:hypothetical protein